MYQLGGGSAQQSLNMSGEARSCAEVVLTCWLINKIPISFLSFVNLSKASSIAALSVLLSTTRKFFCESGGAVTCYSKVNIRHIIPIQGGYFIHQCLPEADQSLNPESSLAES